jgi:DNA-binding CsgD family transcriptional regulator
MRIAPVITLSPEQRTVLESQARSRSLPLRVVERARIVLLAAAGRQDKDIAVLLFMTPKNVSRWRTRFLGTQPGLPLKRGRGATMTHDYKRNARLPCSPR